MFNSIQQQIKQDLKEINFEKKVLEWNFEKKGFLKITRY